MADNFFYTDTGFGIKRINKQTIEKNKKAINQITKQGQMKKDYSEKHCQQLILEYLSTFGLALKIEQSGTPIYQNGIITAMAPFKNSHFVKGVSDIFFLQKGTPYFFEVKAPKVLEVMQTKWVSQNFQEWLFKNDTILRQWNFLDAVTQNGGYGGFVSNPDHCRRIIELKAKNVVIPHP